MANLNSSLINTGVLIALLTFGLLVNMETMISSFAQTTGEGVGTTTDTAIIEATAAPYTPETMNTARSAINSGNSIVTVNQIIDCLDYILTSETNADTTEGEGDNNNN